MRHKRQGGQRRRHPRRSLVVAEGRPLLIQRSTILSLGVSQLVCWGISYYLIGGFGTRMAEDLGWSRALVFGGFSMALLVGGLVSPMVGRMIDRHGGRLTMSGGSVLIAVGCAGIALAREVIPYYAAWLCLGVGMRMTLYDAAFATLARIGGPAAKRPIAQITLLGGLASTAFWPIGEGLAALFGWRGAVLAYAAIALLTVPLHMSLPNGQYGDTPKGQAAEHPPPLAAGPREARIAGLLYALIVALTSLLNSAMSAHMIGLLSGLGVATAVAVWISTLRGVGQSLARLCEVLFGRAVDPFDLSIGAALLLPFCFAVGLLSGEVALAALAFAFFYGAGNGLLTITRGTLPLMLFDPRHYGAIVGRLLLPSFLLQATAPLAYALVIEHAGDGAALILSVAIALVILLCAVVLKLRFRRRVTA